MSESIKRPTRSTKKVVIYDDCVVLSSDDEKPAKRAKKKLSDDDVSFSLETEEKRTTRSRPKKTSGVTGKQSTTKPKSVSKAPRKRAIKSEVAENENPECENQFGEPCKKLKEEPSDKPKIGIVKVKPISDLMSPSFTTSNELPVIALNNHLNKENKPEIRYQGYTLEECEDAADRIGEKLSHFDWDCEECDSHNFFYRETCFRCRCPKPPIYGKFVVGSWLCRQVKCKSINYPNRTACYRCKAEKPKEPHENEPLSCKTELSQMNPGPSISVNANARSNSGFDWICPQINCGMNNFSWRNQCFKCQCVKPPPEMIPSQVPSRAMCSERGNDWKCSNESCGKINFAWRKECFLCHQSKPSIQNFPNNSNPGFEPNATKTVGIKSEFNNKPTIKRAAVKLESGVVLEKDSKEIVKKVVLGTAKVKKEPQKRKAKAETKEEASPSAEKKKPVVKKLKMEEQNAEETGSVSKTASAKHTNENEHSKICSVISRKSNVPFNIVSNVIKLFNSEATVPFIVRYRSHLTGSLTADEIRMLKQRHESTLSLIDKQGKLKKKLEASGYLDPALSSAIDACVTQQELDYLAEPFKVLKTSKLVKVIDLGLSTPAEDVLFGRGIVPLEKFVKEDLELNELIDLIVYYVGEIMSKDGQLLEEVRKLMKREKIYLQVKQRNPTNKKVPDKASKKNRHEDIYSNYYNFNCPYDRVKPFQILAINRGESEHRLTVSLDIPNSFDFKIAHFAKTKWYFRGMKYERREQIFNKGLELMHKKVGPYVKRMIRNDLTKMGEKASLEVFSSNLKNLLLSQPVRNMTVCALDPGFTHGCKVAILNPQQEILRTDVLYLNRPEHFCDRNCLLVNLINDYHVDLLVLGNGVGCRDVELKISNLIDKNWLKGTIKYVVASENGVSVYSCSPEAAEEYPNLPPNLISAVSLAKRIQDPLCELVKVEPKHLGVGMYQHDINEKKLDSVLNDVVSECVSLVGVDVNNAPLRILKRVAGLTESRAKAIIDAREKSGPFVNRDHLMNVKGIGPKSFQQCAGFIKIIPGTSTKNLGKSKLSFNPLDQTIIHPEDYVTAKKILLLNNLQALEIGSQKCIDKINSFAMAEDLNDLAVKFSVPFETIKLILEALSTPLDFDLRSTFDKPLFRNKATSINDLIVGTEMSGRVENVTHFGAFVDLGVECNGLIHSSKTLGKDLNLGQIVKVKILEVDTYKMRISLLLVSVS